VRKSNINQMIRPSDILYEDDYLIALNKRPSWLVQADKTGNVSLGSRVKDYIKTRNNQTGDVYLGIIHRLDRRASGVVMFALTREALARMNRLFRNGEINKIYWIITGKIPPGGSGRVDHYLKKNEKQNKSYAYPEPIAGSKLSSLIYRLKGRSDRYCLLEIELLTGRHHQIRCQLASIGCPVKGDLKYGYPRANKDGSISLHARSVSFIHPFERKPVVITAPVPEDHLWQVITEEL
jgi:23S rRNA pseudouridine1911/1915/1917 synthase